MKAKRTKKIKNQIPRYQITFSLLAVIHERWDNVVSSFTAHLNASLLFYRDQYGLDDDLVELDSFQLDANFSIICSLIPHLSLF